MSEGKSSRQAGGARGRDGAGRREKAGEVILASSHPSGLTGQGKDLGFSLSGGAGDAAGEQKSATV